MPSSSAPPRSRRGPERCGRAGARRQRRRRLRRQCVPATSTSDGLERHLAALGERAQPVIVLNKSDLSDELESTMAAVEAVASRRPRSSRQLPGRRRAREARAVPGRKPNRGAVLGLVRRGQVVAPQPSARVTAEVGSVSSATEGPPRRPTASLYRCRPADSSSTPRECASSALGRGGGRRRSILRHRGAGGRCRFNDCGHETEPGCAVRAAIADEQVDEERLESHRLQRELRHQELKTDSRAWPRRRRARRRFERPLRNSEY